MVRSVVSTLKSRMNGTSPIIQKGPPYLKQTSKKDILDILPSSLCDFFSNSRWSRWQPSLLSDLPSLFWLFFFWDLLILVLDVLPLYSLSFLWDVFFLSFFPITEECHRSKDWCDRWQIDKVNRDVTRRKVKAQMISNSSEVEHVWLTISFSGPPRAIAYLCATRATLTALQTEDIWPVFCFSCPFMSFEAQRKSQYAKLLQFFVANFWLWSRCWHFFNRMAVVCCYFVWALSLFFGLCHLSEFFLGGPLSSVLKICFGDGKVHFNSCQLFLETTCLEIYLPFLPVRVRVRSY